MPGQRWRKKELKKEEEVSMTRQCLCGRSKTYPYCDETHKLKIITESQVIDDKES